MIKHGLTMAEIDSYAETDEIESKDSGYENIEWWHEQLAIVIAENFRVKVYSAVLGNGKPKIIFMGYKNDIEIAKTVYLHAINMIKFQADRFIEKINEELRAKTFLSIWKPSITMETFERFKNDYILGYISGIEYALKKQTNDNNWGLITITDAKVNEKFDKMNLQEDVENKPEFAQSDSSFKEGVNDGIMYKPTTGMLKEPN